MTVPSDRQRDQFIRDGFVHLKGAFPRILAAAGRERLWRDLDAAPDDPSTWTTPVVRLGDYSDEPFRLAVNAPALHDAFDRLVGQGRWMPRGSLGTFPVRFPSPDDPGDAGWHVDAGFYGEDGSMRVDFTSRGRALLMLFLFSDVGPDDAPTRIRVGSHLEIPRLLAPAGDAGLTFIALAQRFDAAIENLPITLATGRAGDVYLCHPFLVHAAQPHRGQTPRFIAQPPLIPAEPITLARPDGDYSPVEIAIRAGLE